MVQMRGNVRKQVPEMTLISDESRRKLNVRDGSFSWSICKSQSKLA